MDAVHTVHAKEAFKAELDGHLIFLTLPSVTCCAQQKLIDIKRCFGFLISQLQKKNLGTTLIFLSFANYLSPLGTDELDFYIALVEQMPLEITFKEGTERQIAIQRGGSTRIVEENKQR